jgi:hypothetical protein
MVEKTYKTYVARYRYDGVEWGFRIPARDLDDAKARLARIPYATIDGELIVTLPAPTGPLAAFVTAFQNFVRWLTASST